MSLLFPFLLFFISFSAYLFSALPSIYWRDAPEFQAIGFLLDIGHPAGSPLYAILIKLFTFIPMGNIAFKTTLASCVFGAGLSTVLYLIIVGFLEILSKKRGTALSTRVWVAFFATLVFSFSNALWQNSNLPEVYTLQNFFTALFILIFLKVSQIDLGAEAQKNIFMLFLSLSFLYGLSLGAHAILILYLPFFFFMIYFLWLRKSSFHCLNTCLMLAFFFLLGFSIYLYLPIRSAQNPYYDWGNPETFLNLMRHVSDRKDSGVHFSIPYNVLPRQLSLYAVFFPDNFSFLGSILGLIGLFYLLIKRETILLLLLGLIFFPPFLFFIRFWGDTSAYLPTFLIFTICMGVGIWCVPTWINERLRGHPHRKKYLMSLWFFLGVQFLLLVINHSIQNSQRSNYWNMRTIMKDSIKDLPSQAVIFTNHTLFGLNYLQQVEGYRPDISVLHLASVLAPQWFTKMEASNFPNIVVPSVPPEKLGHAPVFGSALLTDNIGTHPIFWEPTTEWNYLVAKYLIPGKYFFRISPTFSKQGLTPPAPVTFSQSEKLALLQNIKAEPERAFYADLFLGKGAFFLDEGLYEDALPHLQLAVTFLPEGGYLNMLGVGYGYLEDYQMAEEFFLKSIAENPHKNEPILNLAEVYAVIDKPQKAAIYFNRVLASQPRHIRSLLMLGRIKVINGKKQEALNYFQRVLEIDAHHTDASREIEQLLKELS